MGILNVTPDSFSDGGRYDDVERATARARELVEHGAELIDIGGESTRPGAEPVEQAAELERVLPVIQAIRSAGIDTPISIDTRKAEVARQALAAGANWVNDTSAGSFDAAMLATVAELDCPFVAMHMRGTPEHMQDAPHYEDPVHEILCWLRERAARCLEAGISPSNLVIDPGIGFGKRPEDNVALVRRTAELRSLGLPILSGVSRKAFLGQLTGVREPTARIGATAAAISLCVHDVELAAQVIAVTAAHSGLFPPQLYQP
jgi:dihydropteroate synthase